MKIYGRRPFAARLLLVFLIVVVLALVFYGCTQVNGRLITN